MKKILTLLAILIVIVLPACQAPVQIMETDQVSTEAYPLEVSAEATPVEVVTEAYPFEESGQISNETEQVTIDYAQNFTLEYREGYKLLTVTNPWSGATKPMVYALVPREAEIDADLGDAVVVPTPISSFVALSTTYLSFLEQIDELDSLVAVDSADYTFNAQVRAWVEEGTIATVGSGSTIDVERLIELEPDLIMTSASGLTEWDSHPVLAQAGLPVVINSDYLEQDPLGRAEWSKFIAAFYDKEAEAAQIFDTIVERYQAAKALTEGKTDRVTVLINTAYEGAWYLPGGESFAAILLRDAGAEYLWDDLEGSGAMPIDFEIVVERAKDADYWVNVGFANDLAGLAAMDSRYANFSAFKEGRVFNNNARITEMGGTDYYESGVANPDVLLMDLIAIFYPDLAGEHQLFYYQALQ